MTDRVLYNQFRWKMLSSFVYVDGMDRWARDEYIFGGECGFLVNFWGYVDFWASIVFSDLEFGMRYDI